MVYAEAFLQQQPSEDAVASLTVADLRQVCEAMGVPTESGMRKEEYLAISKDTLFGVRGDPQGDLDREQCAGGDDTQIDLTHKEIHSHAAHGSEDEGAGNDYRVLELHVMVKEISFQLVKAH